MRTSIILTHTGSLPVCRASRQPDSKRTRCVTYASINFGRDDNSESHQPMNSPRFFAADGHPPALTEDWRLVRAQLVARELGGSQPGVPGVGTLVRSADQWAHLISHPEAGCLLVARHANLGMFSHSVVLVTEHDDTAGTSALMLNMPTPIYIANLGLEEDITSAFGHRPLFLGGPMTRHLLHVLHGREDVNGSMRIVNGVYAGGVESASELIRQRKAAPEEFCLLAGYSGWGPGQLSMEIADGAWYVVAASDSLILECLRAASAFDGSQLGLPGADAKMQCWRRVLDAAGVRDHM